MPSSKYTDIEKALIAGVLAVDNTTPKAYPNNELESQPDSLWLQLHNIRAESTPVTLGEEGEDNHPGFLQIDINYPENKGSKEVLEKADELLSYFKSGLTLVYNTQNVRVLSTSLSPGRYTGGYYKVSVTINYYSRTNRS